MLQHGALGFAEGEQEQAVRGQKASKGKASSRMGARGGEDIDDRAPSGEGKPLPQIFGVGEKGGEVPIFPHAQQHGREALRKLRYPFIA
jgi:hypothetical protein